MVYMMPLVIKNLFSRCATRPYPERPRAPLAGSRGTIVNDAGKCILCEACARNCPSQCLTVSKKQGVWRYEPFACVFCGVCVGACPSGSLSQLPQWPRPLRERERVVLKVEEKA